MRHDRISFSVCSMAVLLASVVTYSCLMCLVESFRLVCRPDILIFICCVTAGVAVAAMGIGRSWLIGLPVLIGYFMFLFWKLPEISEGLSTLLYEVTTAYSRCFADVRLLGTAGNDAQYFLTILAIPLCWLCVWVICREGHTALVALACAPVLILCLVVVDLAPVFWLIVLTAALLLLLLSGSVRIADANEGGRLLWWLAVPVAALVMVLSAVSPAETYLRSDWVTSLQSIAEGKYEFSVFPQRLTESITSNRNRSLKAVDLGQAGPKLRTGAPALEYRASASITHLRAVSYGRYENNTWHALEDFPANLTAPMVSAQHTQQLEIRTKISEPILYTAYGVTNLPAGGTPVDDAYFRNGDHLSDYVTNFLPQATSTHAAYEAYVYDHYLQLPEELKVPLANIVKSSYLTSATIIADFVRQLGTYNLDTPKVPDGEDVAVYFLCESQQGYCIHFATSAALLMRAAGIPARYVTGYAVSGEANQWQSVTQDEAHAWVEYYMPETGWIAIDPTPADSSVMPQDSTPVQPDEPPLPEEPPQPDTADENTPSAPSAEPKTRKQHNWLLPVLLLSVFLRRWAILLLRRLQHDRLSPNQLTLSLWCRAVKLYKAAGQTVPEQLICLAEKARFSQHTISEEELITLQRAMAAQIKLLKQRPFRKQLWYLLGSVLY